MDFFQWSNGGTSGHEELSSSSSASSTSSQSFARSDTFIEESPSPKSRKSRSKSRIPMRRRRKSSPFDPHSSTSRMERRDEKNVKRAGSKRRDESERDTEKLVITPLPPHLLALAKKAEAERRVQNVNTVTKNDMAKTDTLEYSTTMLIERKAKLEKDVEELTTLKERHAELHDEIKAGVETKHTLKNSIMLLKQRKAKLQNDVEELESRSRNSHAQAQHAILINEIKAREKDLRLVQRAVLSAREEKEQNEEECKVLHMEAKALTERLGEERKVLVQVEEEMEVTMRLLKEAVDERETMSRETQSRMTWCDAIEKEAKKMKEGAEVVMREILADKEEICNDRARLKAEEKRLAKLKADLELQAQRVSSVEDEALRVQSEQENTRKELDEERIRMKEFADSLNAKMEEIVKIEEREREVGDHEKQAKMHTIILQQQDNLLTNREMQCRKMDDALSKREQSCVRREEEIDEELKKLTKRDDDICKREGACSQREKYVEDEEVRLMAGNEKLIKSLEILEKKLDSCTCREEKIEVAMKNLEERERDYTTKLKKLEDDSQKMSEMEQEVLLLQKVVSEKEIVCKQREETNKKTYDMLMEREREVADAVDAVKLEIDKTDERSKELSERDALCVKMEEDLVSRDANVTVRENSCTAREFEMELLRRQLVESEDAQLKEMARLVSLERSVVEKETTCSILRDNLRWELDEARSEREMLAAERETIDERKKEFQMEMTRSQDSFREQKNMLADLAKENLQKEGRLAAQEDWMNANKSAIEGKERILNDKDSKLQQVLIDLEKQTELLLTKEESLNQRERVLAAQADRISKAMDQISNDRAELELKVSEIAAKEKALAQDRADFSRQEIQFNETSNSCQKIFHQQEKDLARLQEFVSKKIRAVKSKAFEVSEMEVELVEERNASEKALQQREAELAKLAESLNFRVAKLGASEESVNTRKLISSSHSDRISKTMELLSMNRSELKANEAFTKERSVWLNSRFNESSKKSVTGVHEIEEEVAAFMQQLNVTGSGTKKAKSRKLQQSNLSNTRTSSISQVVTLEQQQAAKRYLSSHPSEKE